MPAVDMSMAAVTASVRLTVEVQDGLAADGRVRQDERLQAPQARSAERRRRLQAEVGNALQLQNLQLRAALSCRKQTGSSAERKGPNQPAVLVIFTKINFCLFETFCV